MKRNKIMAMELLDLIERSCVNDSHLLLCKVMSAFWEEFGKNPSVVEKLYSVANANNKIDGKWWFETIKSNSKPERRCLDISNKRNIIAFDEITDVPVIIVDGELIKNKTKVSYRWITDKTLCGTNKFKISYFGSGIVKHTVERSTE